MRDLDTSTEELAADYGSVNDNELGGTVASPTQEAMPRLKRVRKIRKKSGDEGNVCYRGCTNLFNNTNVVTLLTAATTHNLLEGTNL